MSPVLTAGRHESRRTGSRTRSSSRSPERSGTSCSRTATAWWARCTTRRTSCRRPTSAHGSPTTVLRASVLAAHLAVPHRHERLSRRLEARAGGPCRRGLVAPGTTADAWPSRADEVPWLEPLPPARWSPTRPAGRQVAERHHAAGLRCDALRRSAARQRADSLLRDVLSGVPPRSPGIRHYTAAVNSRSCAAPASRSPGRATVVDRRAGAEPEGALLEKYVAAFGRRTSPRSSRC